MPPPSEPLDARARNARTWAAFLALSAIWGSSFLFIEIGLDEGIPPFTIVSLRALFGSLFLAGVLVLTGGQLPVRWDVWRRFLVLGLTNVAVPFALIAWGQQYISSGMASILNALVPFFTILLASLVLHDEMLTLARLGGLVVGFVGVILLALPSLGAAFDDAVHARALIAMLAVVLATVSYAVAAVYTRLRLSGQRLIEAGDGTRRAPRPQEIALGSTLAALPAITIMALLFERPANGLLDLPQSGTAWVAVLWLGLLGTGTGYLLFFGILERWGATRTTLVTYVIPIVAVSLGFLVLGERLQPLEILGATLIIGGVVLVNGSLGQRPIVRSARDAAARAVTSRGDPAVGRGDPAVGRGDPAVGRGDPAVGRGRLYAGTSGFAYPSWIPRFYAPGRASRKLLTAYASRLPAVELHNTFYRRPANDVVARWLAQTPRHFRFCPKAQRGAAWRAWQHGDAAEPADPTAPGLEPAAPLAWLAESFATFGDRLGCVLLSTRGSQGRDDDALERLLAGRPPGLPLALELPHPSWDADEVHRILSRHEATLVATDWDDREEPTLRRIGGFLYLRLRRTDYSEADMTRWADRLAPFLADGVDAFVFLRHDEDGGNALLAETLLGLSGGFPKS